MFQNPHTHKMASGFNSAQSVPQARFIVPHEALTASQQTTHVPHFFPAPFFCAAGLEAATVPFWQGEGQDCPGRPPLATLQPVFAALIVLVAAVPAPKAILCSSWAIEGADRFLACVCWAAQRVFLSCLEPQKAPPCAGAGA